MLRKRFFTKNGRCLKCGMLSENHGGKTNDVCTCAYEPSRSSNYHRQEKLRIANQIQVDIVWHIDKYR